MDRRTLLGAGGAIAVVSLSGAPARAAVRRPIFEWTRPGGFFFPGESILTPPPLAIYDDNTAYADASASLPLRPRQAESLRAHAAEVLDDPRNLVRDPDQPVRDRPVDHVSVRLEDGTFRTAELEGWGDGDPYRAFPEPMRALDKHVQQLGRTVLTGGEPWRPNAIRLAAVRLDHEPGAAAPWPAGLPWPDTSGLYAEIDLHGRPAQLARRTLPAGLPLWPAYRTSPVEFLRATWRHLLPHEL